MSARFKPSHQSYHQGMANHTAQLAIKTYGGRLPTPSSTDSSPHPNQTDSAWSDIYSSQILSPIPTTQSLRSDTSDILQTPKSSTSPIDSNNHPSEVGISMPDSQSIPTTSIQPSTRWQYPQPHQQPQSLPSGSAAMPSPYVLPDWMYDSTPFAPLSTLAHAAYSHLPIPTSLPLPSHFGARQSSFPPAYSFGYGDNVQPPCDNRHNTLGLGFDPSASAGVGMGWDQQASQGALGHGYNPRRAAGISRSLAYITPTPSAFSFNHSFSPPLSPAATQHLHEHGLIRPFANDRTQVYNSVASSSGAGPTSAILPAVSSLDWNSPQSPAFQSPTPPTPFVPTSTYPSPVKPSATIDPPKEYSFRHYSEFPSQPAEPATRPQRAPAKGKKGRKRFTAKPGEASTEWESVTDKKERRRTQNRLAQRAFRARTRDQNQTA